MDHQEILDICKRENPDIIYLAIGCSMAHWPVGDRNETPQGHPPPVKALGGRQLCILIDPTLENPPRCTGLTEPTMDPIIRTSEGTYITLRRYFEWDNDDIPLIDMLCQFVLKRRSRLIVQDYAGAIINKYYPLGDPAILKQVLFDMNYQNRGCFIDFSKVRILTRPDGSFVQPFYEPVADILPYLDADQRYYLLKQRTDTVSCYVKRLHNIQSGTEEYRDWCTAGHLYRLMGPLTTIYGTSHSTDNVALEHLMVAYLHDLCQTVGDFISDEDALAIARKPGKEYIQMVEMLRGILTENV
jgi:hypothetical protein